MLVYTSLQLKLLPIHKASRIIYDFLLPKLKIDTASKEETMSN